MTNRDLQMLKDKLPRGYRIRIQKMTGLSFGMIDYVFKGDRTNYAVIDAALEILEEHEEEKRNRAERLRSALNKVG